MSLFPSTEIVLLMESVSAAVQTNTVRRDCLPSRGAGHGTVVKLSEQCPGLPHGALSKENLKTGPPDRATRPSATNESIPWYSLTMLNAAARFAASSPHASAAAIS